MVYGNRGLSYYRLDQNESAIQDYNKAIELDPQFVIFYSNRALAYEKIGQYDKAIADRKKAAELQK